jgi:hypothetical protein
MHSTLFSTAFIQEMMSSFSPGKEIIVTGVSLIEVDNSASILAVLTSAQTEKQIGHFGLRVVFSEHGKVQTREMVMKVKPHGDEIVNMLASLATLCEGELSNTYPHYKSLTGFQFTHVREQEIYRKLAPSFTPEIFGLYSNAETGIYIILMEYLKDVDLLNTVMHPNKWSEEHIKNALAEMAKWHAKMLNSFADLDITMWPDAPSLDYMTKLTPLWSALLNNAATKFPDLYTLPRVTRLQSAISDIPVYWKELELLPKTLIHNDFNPRNSCFKTINGQMKLCLYDWELATFHIPQYDVAEFLCFVLDEDRYDKRTEFIEYYRKQLNGLNSQFNNKEKFLKEFYFATVDFGIHRLGMYMMAHSVAPYPYLPRVVNSFFDTIDNFGN